MEEKGLVPVVVVIVPFPAQGHLNQLLHLSRILSARALPVHFVGSATHNRQAKLRVHGVDQLTISTIHFHDLPLPSFPNPPPDPHAPNRLPAHLQPSFDATFHLRQPFAALLRSLSSTARRVAIIHDDLMSFAAQEALNHPNADSYAFHSFSALSHFFVYLEGVGKDAYPHLKVPELPPLSIEGCFTQPFLEFIYYQLQMMESTSGHIYNTCPAIEGEYIDLMAQGPFALEKIWAVGPFNPTALSDETQELNNRQWCLEWLDKQPSKSVIYVSFGTMSPIPDDQIREVAIGLERSEQRFIWVLREADRGDIFAEEEGRELLLFCFGI